MLSNILKPQFVIPKCDASLPLAKLAITQEIKTLSSQDEVEIMLSTFGEYDLEMTISPKSSNRLKSDACITCGYAASCCPTEDQYEIMVELMQELVNKFSINITTVYEYYKDKINLHSHSIINRISRNKITKIKNYINNYYEIYSPILVNIKPIKNIDYYKIYMMKDISDMIDDTYYPTYYTDNKINIKELSKIKELDLRKLQQRFNPIDEFAEHQLNCIYDKCRICEWISRTERIGMDNTQLDEDSSE